MGIRTLTAERIRTARLAAGYRQQKLAAPHVGFTPQILSLWELGRVEPSAAGLRGLARAYGVSTDWLLGLRIKAPTICSQDHTGTEDW